MPYGNFTVNSGGGGTEKVAASRQYISGQGLGGLGFGSFQPNGSNIAPSGRRRSDSGHSGAGTVDPALAANSAAGGGGGGGGQGGGGGRMRGGGNPLRVCGSSMVRCVSPQEGAVVSVHHFNTELGSPLVYGTRKGGVRSWDLRAREVGLGVVWCVCGVVCLWCGVVW